MKSKKFVSLLLAACLSLSAMTVNAWAENGGENKEVPAPVVQELEGEKPEETKPEEPKTEETGEGEDKKDQETNEGENKETNKDETKETDKDENKAGEGEDKKNEETKPADPSAAVAYGTAAVAMALNNGNSNPPGDNEPFSESTVTVVKHIEGLSDKPLTNEDLAKIMEQLERNPLTISFNNEEFKASDGTRTADGWKWEPQPFDGTVTEGDVKETGNEVDGYNLSILGIDVKKETSTSTTVIVTNYYTKKEVTPEGGTFTITKVDADNHDLKLTGAQFTLKKDGYEQTRTSDQGIAAFYDVPVGIYTLTETVAPQGYVKPNEIYTVKVNENGKISVWKVTAPSGGDFTVTLPDDFIIQNPDGNVVVEGNNFVVENTKEAPGTTSYTFMKHGVVTTVDSNGRTIRTTESPLAGAEFTLYDAEENMLQTVRSAVDGSVTFSNLIDGGYYIIKETKAPSGYTGWNGRIKLSVHFDEQGKPEIRVLVEYLSENREENITGELTVRNYTTVKETEHPVDDRYDDDDDYVLPTVTRKDNKKPANKPERAPRVEEVIPSKRNPETGSSSSMPIAMAAAAVSLTGLVVLCKKKDK